MASGRASLAEIEPSSRVLKDQRIVGSSRFTFEAVFALITLGSIALALSIVGHQRGWPLNDEYFNAPYFASTFSPALVTQIYAAHLRHGDIFPIWSSTDAYGLGTPILLYYSKLFYYVSGSLFIAVGVMKTTLVLSTAVFMGVGIYGMRMALSVITRRRLLLVVGSIGLIFTNWAFSDWLGRGDFAEFSAMMLVPWVLWWCLNLVTNRRASYALIAIMVLLVIAHAAIALCAVIAVVGAIVTFALGGSRRELKKMAIRRIGVCVLGVAVVLAPLLYVTLRFNSEYDPARKITQHGYVIANEFRNPAWLFYAGGFRWLNPKGVRSTVQIDFDIWIPIALGIAVLVGATLLWRNRLRLERYIPLSAIVFLVGAWQRICSFSSGSQPSFTTASGG
jgi:hypothetical protein